MHVCPSCFEKKIHLTSSVCSSVVMRRRQVPVPGSRKGLAGGANGSGGGAPEDDEEQQR